MRHLDNHVFILWILEYNRVSLSFSWLTVIYHNIHTCLLIKIYLLAWLIATSALVQLDVLLG